MYNTVIKLSHTVIYLGIKVQRHKQAAVALIKTLGELEKTKQIVFNKAYSYVHHFI